MFMMREVFHCKPGSVTPLVKKFKELNAVVAEMKYKPFRIYTDVAAEQFWTLVLESEFERMEDAEAMQAKVMADERARKAMADYHEFVVRGRREIYKIEA